MPVEPISLGVGTGFAITGILLAFKGVVGSANLFADIKEKDNEQRTLALEYFVEVQKISVWGEACRVGDGDESLLAAESLATNRMIAGVLGEMQACIERARRYITHYGMDTTRDNINSQDSSDLKFMKVAAVDVKTRRDEVEQQHKFRWATRDKTKFSEIIQHMRSLNDDLRDLTRGTDTKSLAAALAAYLLPQIKETLTLQALTQGISADPPVKSSAKLKLLQESPDQIQNLKEFQYKTHFKPDADQRSGTRTTGYFQQQDHPTSRSWIEWRRVESDLSSENQRLITSRIRALAKMLVEAAASKVAEYSLPPCQALIKDDQDEIPVSTSCRFGFVFSVPGHLNMQRDGPQTLIQFIQYPDKFFPVLEVRFDLAYKLASAMSLMHASKWLHKGFRSDNVLFLNDASGNPVVNQPFLTGFEYSRPETQVSLRDRQTDRFDLDLYYHPDLPMHDFNRIHDIYSLGVVLLEIALWKPLKDEVSEQMLVQAMKDYFLSDITMQAVAGVMGSSYRDAVRVCLTGNFDVRLEDDGSDLSRQFTAKVLRKLSYCRA
jgi:Prion-inhibition and propagation